MSVALLVAAPGSVLGQTSASREWTNDLTLGLANARDYDRENSHRSSISYYTRSWAWTALDPGDQLLQGQAYPAPIAPARFPL